MNSTRISSTQVHRMFEEFCAAGLTPEESLSALRNDGFSQSDLIGLAPAKSISRGPREAQRNRGASSSCAPHSADLFALSIIWEQADARPWHMLAVVIAGGASLVALTAWKFARYTWRKIRR